MVQMNTFDAPSHTLLSPHCPLAARRMNWYSYSDLMAPDGKCKLFDAAAVDGFARSEGAVCIVLIELELAGDAATQDDGDEDDARGLFARAASFAVYVAGLQEYV